MNSGKFEKWGGGGFDFRTWNFPTSEIELVGIYGSNRKEEEDDEEYVGISSIGTIIFRADQCQNLTYTLPEPVIEIKTRFETRLV